MAKEILLQLKDVHVRYGGVKALDGVDVSLTNFFWRWYFEVKIINY